MIDELICKAEGCDRPRKIIRWTRGEQKAGERLDHCGLDACRARVRRRKDGKQSQYKIVPCNWCGSPTRAGKSRITNAWGFTIAHCSKKCNIDARSSKPNPISGNPLTTIETILALIDQKLRCGACGVRYPLTLMDVDHIHPKRKGGAPTIDNIQILCRSCNSSKGRRSMAKFLKEGLIWSEMRVNDSDALHNFIVYITHKKIVQRCLALITGVLPPQRWREIEVCTQVLQFIGYTKRHVHSI